MARGQKFEEYVTKWRTQAAKHIPPISEARQIQLFHSTLRGVYYSNLLAHTSSFSSLIDTGKKLDMGIKLGKIEGPTRKEEQSSKNAATAPSPTGILPTYSGTLPTHLPPPTSSGALLPPVSLTSAATDDRARITALEGTVNQMAANMAELLALLRGQNRASSSSTPPPGQGPTADPAPGIPPTQAPENMDAPTPPTLHTSVAQPLTNPYPSPPAPTAVPLPPAAFLTSDQAEDIPTWDDLSRKFIDQYRYCAETPPTLLELSTKEMARGQKFEEYVTKWRTQAAKHIPPISEARQIQLFHSTLRGVYYSNLLAHTSSFSSLIDTGKKLDMGIKLGKIEGPTRKEEQSSKNAATAPSPTGKSQLASHRYPTRQRLRMTEENRVDISEEVNPPVPVHSQPPPTHAPPPPTPAGTLPAYSGAPPTHLPPLTSLGAPLPRVSLTSFASDNQARITALEGTVNQLAASMTANMAELFALLRGPNRSSSSSTPPPGQGPTVDPTPCVPPTQIPENIDAPAPPTLHTSTAHPFTSPFSPPPAPTAVPLPPATFLSSEQAPSAPPLVSIPAPAAIYTVPPPMVFSAPSAPAPTHPQAAELPSYPPLQPHTNFPYQAPPPINTTCHEPGTPTHAAQFASPTHFFAEADTEQERRLKRMEETIRALQASDTRPDAPYGDCSLFPGMRLPTKVKIPEFRIYEGTTDLRHHLRHYQGKMLQY
ncbi:extensin-like [Punica granatum]|uniref:Extensin-like n=1 Tax=Punica granatum TaxID=22663 RepID=A0A6P8BWW0_PUNGR|nr:extensin-like [Punica granatum]